MSQRQLTAAEVLEQIMNLPSDDSGDESGRDSDIEDIEQQPVQENEELEAADAGQIQGRDGTRWRMVTDVNGCRGQVEQ